MAAVAHLSPAPLPPARPSVARPPLTGHRRLVVVRSAPVSRPGPAPVSPTTYRRRRVAAAGAVAAVLLALMIAVQGLLGVCGAGPAGPERPAASGAVYVVQPGDTFWDIARMLRPEGDPRPLVTSLVAAHGSPVLRVGERIPLPDGA